MGPVGFLVAGLAVSAATTIYSVIQQRKAQRAQKTAREIQNASEDYKNILARRKAAKEERIRRARLMSASSAAGTVGSSGELGALGAITSNAGQAVAQQTAFTAAAQGISAQNQKIADAESNMKTAQAFSGLFSQATGLYTDYQKTKDLFT